MQVSNDTAVQHCKGREIMHMVIRHANDLLCMGQGHGSGMKWQWCGDVAEKMQQ